jgi:hypothetical protein
MSGARYERRDDRYRDDRRDREWYVPLRAGENRSVLHDRRLSRIIHATIVDEVSRIPHISHPHETHVTLTEAFAMSAADLPLPPTSPAHLSPQGPEGR